MVHTGSKKGGQERLLLNRRSLETGPPELRQLLAYVLHLRSYWKPEGRAKLVIPASWMEFLTIVNGECGVGRVAERCCPFRNVRFDSDAEARLAAPGEELPGDIVSQLLTNFGMDDCLTTLVPRAFEGTPRTGLRSGVRATRHFSQSALRGIDFGLVPSHGDDDTENTYPAKSHTHYLLLGMKQPTQVTDVHTTSFDSRSGLGTLASIPEELTTQGQRHLRLLASLIKREAVETTSFPEWLVLFGLVYDVHRVRVVAYVPHRRTLDVIECATHVVDELSFHSITGAPTCELALECMRFLLVLTVLRRHVHHLSKSLFTTMGSRDSIRQTDNRPSFHDQRSLDGSESLDRCLGSGQHCGSEYSTCSSSVRNRELDAVSVLECGEGPFASSASCLSSFCSTCSSSCTSDSLYPEDSGHTSSEYMEPSLSQGDNKAIRCSHKLTETKILEIIAWTRETVPTEHPVRDNYRMVVHHSYPTQ